MWPTTILKHLESDPASEVVMALGAYDIDDPISEALITCQRIALYTASNGTTVLTEFAEHIDDVIDERESAVAPGAHGWSKLLVTMDSAAAAMPGSASVIKSLETVEDRLRISLAIGDELPPVRPSDLAALLDGLAGPITGSMSARQVLDLLTTRDSA